MNRKSVTTSIISLVALAGCEMQAPTTREISPDSMQPAAVTIVERGETGRRLEFSGRILDYSGRPLSKAAVVLYNADANGLYNPPDSPTRVPRIRGVAITDDHGRFRFITVWPGPYPNDSEPAHLHLQVNAPAHDPLFKIYWFEGDRLITRQHRAELRPDSNVRIVSPKESDGLWRFEDDVRLSGN